MAIVRATLSRLSNMNFVPVFMVIEPGMPWQFTNWNMRPCEYALSASWYVMGGGGGGIFTAGFFGDGAVVGIDGVAAVSTDGVAVFSVGGAVSGVTGAGADSSGGVKI
jgi:hypothetical protein